MDPYSILGVDKTSQQTDIKKAYRKLAKKYLSHRGIDDDGIWISKDFGFAHTRLSIIDLSKNARQP